MKEIKYRVIGEIETMDAVVKPVPVSYGSKPTGQAKPAEMVSMPKALADKIYKWALKRIDQYERKKKAAKVEHIDPAPVAIHSSRSNLDPMPLESVVERLDNAIWAIARRDHIDYVAAFKKAETEHKNLFTAYSKGA